MKRPVGEGWNLEYNYIKHTEPKFGEEERSQNNSQKISLKIYQNNLKQNLVKKSLKRLKLSS